MQLVPLGDRRWQLGNWELWKDRRGFWVAVPESEGCPPLFAATLESLAWLVRCWNSYVSKAKGAAAANARLKLQLEQQGKQVDPDDHDDLGGDHDDFVDTPHLGGVPQTTPEPAPQVSSRVARILARRRLVAAA